MITIRRDNKRHHASTLLSYLIDSASWFRFECHSLTDNIALVTYISRLHRDIFAFQAALYSATMLFSVDLRSNASRSASSAANVNESHGTPRESRVREFQCRRFVL